MCRTLGNSESLRILPPPLKIGTLLFSNKSLMSSKFPALPNSMEKNMLLGCNSTLWGMAGIQIYAKNTLSMVKTFPFSIPIYHPKMNECPSKGDPFKRKLHLPGFDMEPKNNGFQKESPISGCHSLGGYRKLTKPPHPASTHWTQLQEFKTNRRDTWLQVENWSWEHRSQVVNLGITPLKFKMAPGKWWLEDYFPFGIAHFQGLC